MTDSSAIVTEAAEALLIHAERVAPILGLDLRELYRVASIPPGQPGALLKAAAHGVAGRAQWERLDTVSIVRRGRIEGTPEGWAAAAPCDIRDFERHFWRAAFLALLRSRA